jgi:hypothetical protein
MIINKLICHVDFEIDKMYLDTSEYINDLAVLNNLLTDLKNKTLTKDVYDKFISSGWIPQKGSLLKLYDPKKEIQEKDQKMPTQGSLD